MLAIIKSETKMRETWFPFFPEEGMKKRLFLGDNDGVVQYIDLYYSNGSWILMQSRNLSFSYQGKDIGNKQLDPYDLIQISSSNTQYLLYITNSPNKPMLRYHIPNNEKITIGSNDSNTIVYKAPLTAKTHVTISYENNGVSVKSKDKQSAFFLNGEKTYSSMLSFGDIITILGLRIVYLDTMLAVNCPDELKECKLAEIEPETEDSKGDLVEEEADTGTYGSYFHRSPRIIKRVDQEPLKVDPPPGPINMQQQPLFLRMGPSLLMGVAMLVNTMMMLYTNNSNPAAFIGRIAMTVAMLAGMILWPIFTNIYYKFNTATKEKKRVKRYRQYMKKKFGEMEERLEDNRKILLLTYPDPTVCMNRVMNLERRIWEKMPVHQDFLEVRIGTGTVPNPIKSNAPEDHFTMEDDYLLEELKEVNKAYLNMRDVSIPISLFENKMVGFIGQRAMLIDIVMSLLVQISALHSYDEVKVFAIFPEHETDRWEWIKHLPHVWAPEKSARYVASNEEEVREVFSHLNEIIKQREECAKESGGKSFPRLPHLVVLIAAPELVENQPVMRYLITMEENYGVSSLLLFEEMALLPKECNAFIQCTETECSLYHRDKPEAGMIQFKPDNLPRLELESFARKLAALKIKESASALSIPSTLAFLEMYGVGRVEQLDIKRRWRENHAFRSLEAPLGYMAGEAVFMLNLHEKYHGPHGLIAGMTGSGKSEFIISFLLSLAVNYHPNQVSFILIDYKGGGMANSFIGLPHVAGTITNLGGNQVHRSLVSLQSELKRRQRVFAACGVNHIDKYQQLFLHNKVLEPIPHLLIISDEFAELKSQQPEFMNELVSAARIGRSLGIHLVLATQKPAGVVNDQIWSNSRFRVCLKVLDKNDSNEMLKKPDAAYIVQPGRCYVQVGNDEIFELVQSCWSGAPYVPEDKIENDEEKQISLIDICGRSLRTVSSKSATARGTKTQLEAVVEHIADLSAKEALQPQKLWLDSLRETIYHCEADKRSGGWNGEGWEETDHWLKPILGIVDNPYEQTQLPLMVDIGKEGSLVLFGAPGTGKTTFLQSLIYALAMNYSPDDVNIYVMDFGGRTLGYFSDLPHVGGVVFSDEEEKIEKLLKLVTRELDNRKRLFSEFNVGNIQAYMQSSGQKIPAIVIVIDNYSVFTELYADDEPVIVSLSRDGGNYGINLVITSSSINSVKSKILQNVRLMMTLQLNDKYDYTSVLGQTNGLEPDKVKGRGLVKGNPPLEFHTVLSLEAENDFERVNKLKQLFQQMNLNWKGKRARQIPCVPEQLSLELFCSSHEVKKLIARGELPFAYDLAEAELLELPLSSATYTILGHKGMGKTNLLKVLLKIMKELNGLKVYVVDNAKKQMQGFCSICPPDQYICEQSRLEELLEALNNEMVAYREAAITTEAEEPRGTQRHIILVDDFCSFFEMLSGKYVNIMEQIVSGDFQNVHAVFTAEPAELSRYRTKSLYRHIFNGIQGILLGGRVDSQNVFSPKMNYRERDITMDPGQGYLFEKSNNYKIIKVPEA